MSVTARAGAELFAPELVLGADALHAGDRELIAEFVRAVAVARGFPLHVAVAWNALHFGYDLAAGSYPAEALSGFMPTIALNGAENPAVPVGALAWVHVGGTDPDVWVEVVGKDGRPAGGGELFTDPAVAAAPAQPVSVDGFEMASVTEALVVDFAAFGLPDANLGRRLERLRNRGRLDPHGLVLTDALYLPPEAADDDDLWFYARWLLDHQPELLRAGPLGTAVGADADDSTLRTALLASFAAVSDIAVDGAGLRRWGDYILAVEWVDAVEDEENLPLGSADLAHLLAGWGRAGRDGPAAATLLPRLEEFAASGPVPGRPDRIIPDRLGGVGFLCHVARSNRWLADRVDEAGRVLACDGRSVTVRIDDIFPFGGLWRAEPVAAGHPLLDVPADVPLSLGGRGIDGVAKYLGVSLEEVAARIDAAWDAAEAKSEEGPAAPEGAAPDGEELAETAPFEELDATLVSATVTLRARDVNSATARLPEVFDWMDGPVTVMLNHSGEIDDDQVAQAATVAAGVLTLEVSWPIDFFAGIRLHLSVFGSGTTVFAATLPLIPPEHGYGFAFDPALLRDPPAGDAGSGGGNGPDGGGGGDYWPGGDEDSGGGKPEVIPFAAVLLTTLARRGRAASDGSRRASARDLAIICFGPGRPAGAVEAITSALDPLVADGRLGMLGTEYTWVSARPSRPGRTSAPSGWSSAAIRVTVVVAHVPGFLRRLAPGYTASDDKRASYRQALAEGLILFGPADLPEGYTWVRPHERGGGDAAYQGALAGIVSTITGESPGEAELREMRRAWGLDQTPAGGDDGDEARCYGAAPQWQRSSM